MIQSYTRLHVADNSGARRIRLINIPGSSRRKYASVGDIVVCTVREAVPNSPVRKGTVVKAVVVRQAAPLLRPDGTYIRFDDNAAVLINDNQLPRGDPHIWTGRQGIARQGIHAHRLAGSRSSLRAEVA